VDVYCLVEAGKEKQSESEKLSPSKWNEASFFYPGFADRPCFRYRNSGATLLVEASQICKPDMQACSSTTTLRISRLLYDVVGFFDFADVIPDPYSKNLR
jgi:hypothetical protein